MPSQTANLQNAGQGFRSSGSNATLTVKAAKRARSAQWVLEALVFSFAAVFVVVSAVNAKKAQMGPLLAAVEASGEQGKKASAIPFVAATDSLRAEVVEEELAVEPEPVEPITAESAKSGAGAGSGAGSGGFGIGTYTPQAGARRYFDGRPIRPKKTIWMTVTGYSPDARSCGDSADGRTATNHSVWTNGMNLVAADPRLLPYGSIVSIPGYAENEAVPVLDCGGAIKGTRLDLLYPSHAQAIKWGVKRVKVTVWEYADNPS